MARGDDVVPDDHHVWLEGGFQAGRIYDLIYAPAALPVAGAGLLALRDFGAWLRRSPDSPVAGRVDHFLLEGQSQTGRALRHFLWLGLNADESGRPVYDGVLAHIAGARRGEFNQRHAQPSVQPTPGFGHLPPFDDAGLLERQRHAGGVPRIMFTDTSSEYWRGDASLTHLDGDAGGDLDPPPEVRRYLFASTQHGPGMPPFARLSIFGSHGANCFNLVDYRPLYRAALMNLLAWVADRREPPPSSVPRVDGGTAAERQAVLDALAAIPALALPAAGELPSLHPLDLGAGASRGIGTWPARVTGPARPCRVAAVDADGNERAGVAMPDVTVPVATHTGFNPRHPESGGAGQILEYMGSTLPFPVDEDARRATGDPRPSIAARYRDRDDYLARVREAADRLVAQHWLLPEDVAVCVDIAGARYDACLAGTPTDHD